MQLQRLDDFTGLRTAFPMLAAPPSTGSLFESFDWFALLAQEALPADTPLQLYVASENDQALCLPLIRQGPQSHSLSNYYTGLYSPLCSTHAPAGWRQQALAEICRQLRREDRPPVIQLQPLAPEGPVCHELQQALIAAGYRIDTHFSFGNWHLPCAGLRFADFFAARPAAVRNTVRRARGRLDKAGPWQIAIHTAPGPALEQAIADFEAIYRQSWKPAESYPGFVSGLCRLAARRGWLRLGVLQQGGHAIASQIWLFDNGTAYIFKLAYDPAAARYSPGSVLTAALMEYALDHDAAQEIDYLSGDDAYKQDWMSQRRERQGLIAFDPATVRGGVALLRHHAGRLRRALKP